MWDFLFYFIFLNLIMAETDMLKPVNSQCSRDIDEPFQYFLYNTKISNNSLLPLPLHLSLYCTQLVLFLFLGYLLS